MSYLNIADLAAAKSLRTRVVVAMVAAAGDVLVASQGQLPAAHFNKRTEYARNVVRSPESFVDGFIWPVLSSATIATAGLDSTDAQLKAQVAAVWDIVAGVTAEDKQPDPVPPA